MKSNTKKIKPKEVKIPQNKVVINWTEYRKEWAALGKTRKEVRKRMETFELILNGVIRDSKPARFDVVMAMFEAMYVDVLYLRSEVIRLNKIREMEIRALFTLVVNLYNRDRKLHNPAMKRVIEQISHIAKENENWRTSRRKIEFVAGGLEEIFAARGMNLNDLMEAEGSPTNLQQP